MAIKEKTIKVRCCDFCGAAEEIEKEPIRTCSSCGKDFCIDCGEVFSAEYGNVEVEGYDGDLLLCKECLTQIFKNKRRKKGK